MREQRGRGNGEDFCEHVIVDGVNTFFDHNVHTNNCLLLLLLLGKAAVLLK